MEIKCSQTNVFYPMTADIFYPSVDQSAYGNVVKTWMLDRTVAGNFVPAGAKTKEEITANPAITQETLIVGRIRCDVRVSSNNAGNAVTNVLITNIKDKFGQEVYVETSGPRVGKSTLFEIATQEPVIGFAGGIEYYKLVLRRSENQAVNV